MSEPNKGHSTMGLPRASGKRGWSGEQEDSVPAAKVLCTSPPHALCAEDVLQHPALTHAHASTPALECELTSGTNDPTSTHLEEEEEEEEEDLHRVVPDLPGHHHFTHHHSDGDDQSDDDDFIDDEEDKDSGFIDSNSIDNSSDDEVEARTLTADSGVSCASSGASTSLQLSLSQVLAPSSPQPLTSTSCTLSNTVTKFVTPGLTSPLPGTAPALTITTPSPAPGLSLAPGIMMHTGTSSALTASLTTPTSSPVITPALSSPITISSLTMSTPPSPLSIPIPPPLSTTPPPPLVIPVHPSLPSVVTNTTTTTPAVSLTITTTTTSTSPAPITPLLAPPTPPILSSSPTPPLLPSLTSMLSPHPMSPAPTTSTVTTSTTTTIAGCKEQGEDVTGCDSNVEVAVTGREERGVTVTGSLTTVTATQTGTVVTSAYQGALPSPAYEPHPFGYTGESYPSRPSTPTWESCNYYDGSQPTTNKYMEISPSKSSSSQSIQCDENGKSYLELGSASPYTHTYSNECGNYTTSPSTYHSQPYNQTYTSSSSYAQPNLYYNPRQSYSPSPYNVYPAGENYTNFEGEPGCSYGYGANAYNGGRTALPPTRGPPRCMSPYCDPTRGSPRPSCYHQQRLSVLNLSMLKLNRFRQFPDPSLHRSVLICNTLRHIERELEAEGVSVASLLAHSHTHAAHPHLQGTSSTPGTPPCPEPIPSSPPSSPTPTEGTLPPMHSPLVGSPLAAAPPSTPTSPAVTHYNPPVSSYPAVQYMPSDHTPVYDGRETVHLRPYPTLPTTADTQAEEGPSGVEESRAETEDTRTPSSPRPAPQPQEERTDAINWCSVLSLSSQTDLDSMNNNEYGDWSGEGSSSMDYSRTEDAPNLKLPSLSADDVLKSFPEASKRLEANEDLDSIINVLVGS